MRDNIDSLELVNKAILLRCKVIEAIRVLNDIAEIENNSKELCIVRDALVTANSQTLRFVQNELGSVEEQFNI